MPDPTLYLFDGHNLIHAGGFGGADELVDTLASFVAGRGARGIVVFDGHGEERGVGPLSVRYAPHADDLLERLAAEHRRDESVCLVSSDAAIRGVSGQEVRKLSSSLFLKELGPVLHRDHEQRGSGGRVAERLDPETRERLERLRRGE
jgi:predicted RNA-binding protein with PIN domain